MGKVIHTLCDAIMDQHIPTPTALSPYPHACSASPSPFKPGGKIARATLQNIGVVVSDERQLLNILISAVQQMGATMIQGTEVTSSGSVDCISAGVILSESSAFVHVYRGTRMAVAVIFTCGDSVDPQDGVAILAHDLGAKSTLVTFHQVGEESEAPIDYILDGHSDSES